MASLDAFLTLPSHPFDRREVVGRFDGGAISTDAGGLLLREVGKRIGIIGRFATRSPDHRAVGHVEHTVRELAALAEK